MFSKFSIMLQAFFSAFTKLGGAAEKAAGALDHLAGWAEDTSASFADEARIERQKKLALLNHERNEQDKELAAKAEASSKKEAK